MTNDDYKVLKIQLHNIILHNDVKNKIMDACRRSHLITTHVYQFIRLYILNCYHNNLQIPFIDVNFIKMSFKALSLDSKGPKPKNENLKTLNLLNLFYENEYSKIGMNSKLNASNLSQILTYISVDILTNIENNIKLHFIKYLNRFVNSYFKDTNEEIIKKETSIKNKSIKRKELYKELKEIKDDLINNTSLCIKHKEFIDKYRKEILPKDYKEDSDIQINPQKYMKHMIFMNLEIEKLKKKQFQFFPLRNDLNLKYIPLDSAIVVDLLMKMEKGVSKQKYNSNITNLKEEIWNSSFKLNHKIFKPKCKKQYVFNHMIYTDGYGVSVQFINKNNIEKENNKKLNMKKEKENIKEKCKNKTEDEIKLIKIEIKKEKEVKKLNEKIKNIKIKKEMKEKYKSNKNNKSENKEFKYINDLNDEEFNEAYKNFIVIDPGKRDIYKMLQRTKNEEIDKVNNEVKKVNIPEKKVEINEIKSKRQIKRERKKKKEVIETKKENKKNKFVTYSYKQRLHEIGKVKMNKKIKKYKSKTDIEELEKKLIGTCKKSNKIDEFKKYLKIKMEIYNSVVSLYENSKSRKYKWYSYLNKKRSEDNLMNKIKKEYGMDVTIFIGDWSNGSTQMKHFVSTPRIGLKRKLKKHFKVYNLDEYKTSKMCYKTQEETKNLKVQIKKNTNKENKNKNKENKNKEEINKEEINKEDKNKKEINKEYIKKLHPVLTYRMKNNRIGCLNRDKNSCLNMLEIVETWKIKKEYPTYLKRVISDVNPCKGVK